MTTIEIEIPPESMALIRNMGKLPTDFPLAVKRGMDRSLAIVGGRIQENRLSGKGPFPPTEHRLGEVTGLLRRSTRSEPAAITGNAIIGSIGTNARNKGFAYPYAHEYGGGKFPERAAFRTEINQNVEYIANEIGNEITIALRKL